MAGRNLENITVTMTKEEKKALKQAALDNDCSVSELIRRWLEEYGAREAVPENCQMLCRDCNLKKGAQ